MDNSTSTPTTDDAASFRAITEGAPAMLWLGDEAGHCIFLNRALRDFWGVGHADLSEFDWGATLHPEDGDLLAAPYREGMRTQSPFEAEARYLRADGVYRTLRTSARPRFSDSGEFLGMVGVNTDVTEQRAAEDALRQSSEQLRFALQASGGIGTWVWEVADDRVVADIDFARVFGIGPEEARQGAPIEAFLGAVVEEHKARVQADVDTALRSGGQYRSEYRVRTADGSQRWLLAMGGCELDDEGRAVRFAGVGIDITERKTREEELALLTRELSHRIKNIFAVVQAMTSMAAREDAAAAPALGKLAKRTMAMAAAYSQVTPPAADGADTAEAARAGVAAGSLHRLLDRLFAPYTIDEEPRIHVDGPDVELNQQAASSLALILHELATNAAKYGALSGNGRVNLAIALPGDGTCRLEWIETGGLQLDGPPSEEGFGSRLIRLSSAALNAEIETDWRREGLVWRLTAPLAALTED